MNHDLIEQYLPFAAKLAHNKKKILPSHIDFEDLLSAAYLGLVEAAARFEEEKKVSFMTFAYWRISGEINDYLRSLRSTNTSLESICGENSTAAELIPAKEEGDCQELFEFLTQKIDSEGKDMLKCYFMDECTMLQIASKYNITEGRVSQRISAYKREIRESYKEMAA